MIAVVIAIISAAFILLILLMITGRSNRAVSTKDKSGRRRNNSAVIKEATKKLTHDPRNVAALTALGDIYYSQQEWAKAYPLYKSLSELSNMHSEIDAKQAYLRYGVCAFKTEKVDEAGGAFAQVLKKEPNNFEANFYIGKVLYVKKDFEKTIACMKRAAVTNPENQEIHQILAFSLFNAKKYRESLPYLKKVCEENPDNKEALFYMGSAMEEAGMADKAIKIFMHLRPDPNFGAQSCLAAGTYHDKLQQYEKALQDYDIALKLENVPPELKVSILYKLSHTLMAQNAIAKALVYLRQINSINPNYKDVPALISRYQELTQNTNLQSFIMSGTSDFVTLCRKFITTYHKGSFVKIEDINVSSENTEIMCHVQSARWENSEIFRFFRSTSAVGELSIRELHSKMRDVKCDKGLCVTAGTFSEEAKKYVEGRPIDLIEKAKLVAILKKIDMLN
ncbi:MAG: tetratricopeptide repeat protein [Treponema sp.]|nr:tetratricopeptide repeat protein [Treponema sp.]